jgi:hypothetical protein
MNLGTHMPDGERRKSIDIEDRRTKVTNVGSKWNLVHMCLMVRQRSRSQLLKIEQKFARYLKSEMSDLNETWYTHAWWSKVKVTLSIHMFKTLLSRLWCVTDFLGFYCTIASWPRQHALLLNFILLFKKHFFHDTKHFWLNPNWTQSIIRLSVTTFDMWIRNLRYVLFQKKCNIVRL